MISDLFDADARRREYARDFVAFYQKAWAIVDAAELSWGWFQGLLCHELARWGRGEIRNLAISVPPGTSKSLSASVILPAWMWLRDPSSQFLCCAHGQQLAIRDNQRMRDIVCSEWYQGLIAGTWTLKDDQNQKTRFQNTRHGQRQAIGGKSGLAGWRGDDIIIDDPVDCSPMKPPKPEDLEKAHDWVQYIRRQRINDPKHARTLLIAQRVHEKDPTGRILEEEIGDWHTVYFDLEYDPEMPYRHRDDPREVAGELLCPERIGPIEVKQRRKALGPTDYAAQNQQQPQTPKGALVSEDTIPILPQAADRYDYVILSWDLAFKGEATSSWVAGGVWGINAPDDYDNRRFDLLDLFRRRIDYTETKGAVRRLALMWPEAKFIVIEDKANGPAVISELRHEFTNLVPFSPNPYGDKLQRLRAIVPIIAAGQLRLVKGEWNEEYLAELTRAPKIADWDQVDVTTQAVIGMSHHLEEWLTKHTPRRGIVVGGW